MGILDKIFGKKSQDAATCEGAPATENCSHSALTPRWDVPADMGKEELATYTCEACGAHFGFAEARDLMDRLPPALADRGSNEDA